MDIVESDEKKSVKVTVVEDEDASAENLMQLLNRYGREKNIVFSVTRHKNAITFLNNYRAEYDIVFMDIDMPHMNGIEAAKKLREIDASVLLVFVTNLAQMAIRGYEVRAFDFVVKPVSYYDFYIKMNKLCNHLKNNEQRSILINVGKSIIRINSRSVIYIEVLGHQLIYHTTEGNFKSYGTLSKLENTLASANFAKCNSCYLVNLRFIKKIVGYTLYIGDETLTISHPRRTGLIKSLNAYLGDSADDAT